MFDVFVQRENIHTSVTFQVSNIDKKEKNLEKKWDVEDKMV